MVTKYWFLVKPVEKPEMQYLYSASSEQEVMETLFPLFDDWEIEQLTWFELEDYLFGCAPSGVDGNDYATGNMLIYRTGKKAVQLRII